MGHDWWKVGAVDPAARATTSVEATGQRLPDDELARHCEQAHPRLLGLLVLKTGDRTIAEELAQDTLASQTEPVETRLDVIAAVSSLPRRQQEALLLRFYAGFDVAATAAALSCAEGTITSLTHRALRRLEERNIHLDPAGAQHVD